MVEARSSTPVNDAPEAGSLESEHKRVTRRRFLGWTIGGISAFIAASVGIPAVDAMVTSALGGKQETTVRLGKLADFPEGEPTLTQFTVTRKDGWVQTQEGRAVWVIRKGDQDAVVYNGRCTHLGCAFNWRAGDNGGRFACPCHDGVFDREGQVVSGPPPRRLDTLPAKVENGILTITYQDFRSGIPDKTPA
ncbi:MAG: ubiquinol-cytochrome c reductase iron-sulfur subunit [Anaerolineae bacterium]